MWQLQAMAWEVPPSLFSGVLADVPQLVEAAAQLQRELAAKKAV